MFPAETQLSWRKRRQGGSEEEVPAEEEQLELREGGRTSSIMMVDQDPHDAYEYSCSVKHEARLQTPETKIVVSALPQPPPPAPHWFRERLLCLFYSVLIAKSLLCFCGLSLLSVCGGQGA
ncbi:uncharacterized protein V3H82_016209 [Fundulus diaphanus]